VRGEREVGACGRGRRDMRVGDDILNLCFVVWCGCSRMLWFCGFKEVYGKEIAGGYITLVLE